MDYNKLTCARIKDFREKKKILQKSIAKYLNLSENAYSRIESGSTKLTVNNLFKISEFLEVQVVDLIAESISKSNINNIHLEKLPSKNERVNISVSSEDLKKILLNGIVLK